MDGTIEFGHWSHQCTELVYQSLIRSMSILKFIQIGYAFTALLTVLNHKLYNILSHYYVNVYHILDIQNLIFVESYLFGIFTVRIRFFEKSQLFLI